MHQRPCGGVGLDDQKGKRMLKENEKVVFAMPWRDALIIVGDMGTVIGMTWDAQLQESTIKVMANL